jgi:hypothetical protein
VLKEFKESSVRIVDFPNKNMQYTIPSNSMKVHMLCLFNYLNDRNLSNYIQQRRGRYEVTLRCVSATTVAVEKQLVLHILNACL